MITDKIEHIETGTLQVITPDQAWHYLVVPYEANSKEVFCFADGNFLDENKEEELELLFGKTVHLTNIEGNILRQALGKYYRRSGPNGKSASMNINADDDFLVNLIREARNLGSSDIHLEPYEAASRVRLRIDGVLTERFKLKKEDYPSIVNKIKIKSNLDIAEKRLPQDGRIFFEDGGHKFDIRVSTLPTLHGEKIVMRLLSNNDTEIEIKTLGFQQEDLTDYLEGVYRPNGMVLISGPTGSGKTTTLYATLQVLNNIERNVLTIEDPIEYTLEGINQVQLKENIGLDFASAMRTFLRQDPDIIMVGEIRDVDTASMAIRASLTGHLVLSTIHTNYAWGIVARMIDMGIPSYLLADTLNTAVAQRLVRLLCGHCKVEKPMDENLYPRQYRPPFKLDSHFKAQGCDACYYTGYKGRRAVYEVVPIDEVLAEKIKNKELNVKNILKEKGIKNLAENAFEIFANGQTSLKEVFPILSSNSF